MMMLTVLSGGTGTPKLLQGLVRVVDPSEIIVVVNTAEDVEISGLYVSPDIDTVVYTLAGIVNEKTWYGIAGDTFASHEMLKRLGHSELLRIGDRDRAVKLWRTLLLREGLKLSKITQKFCESLELKTKVLPMSDDRVQTVVYTNAGKMSFHEFWVARRARDRVLDVKFKEINRARPAPGVVEAIRSSEKIIIGPSNPVTSIGPILRVPKIGKTLTKHRKKVLAVSPIIGNSAVSGPAGVLMRGLGYEVSPHGVAEIYKGFAGKIFIDRRDRVFKKRIERLGMVVELAPLLMSNLKSRVRLAETIIQR